MDANAKSWHDLKVEPMSLEEALRFYGIAWNPSDSKQESDLVSNSEILVAIKDEDFVKE